MTVVAARKPTPTSDAELLAGIAAGNLGHLGTIFDRYERDVRRFVVRLAVPRAEVDDVVQAVFIETSELAERFDGRVSARAWILGIAANTVRHHRRSLARVARRLAAWAAEPRTTVAPAVDDAVDVARRADLARRALARLSPKKREVFVMVVLEEVSGEEAAVALGIPVGTVWTRLHHARRELRRRLSKEVS